MMNQTLVYPPVTEELLDEVVRRVLEVGSPHKIVLLGSRARGDARPDSDLDLLILVGHLPRMRPLVVGFLSFIQCDLWQFNHVLNGHGRGK